MIVWMLAKPDKDPLELLVLKSPPDQGVRGDETLVPLTGRHPFVNRKAGTVGGSGMISEVGMTMTTTTRVLTKAVVAKRKALSIAVITPISGSS